MAVIKGLDKVLANLNKEIKAIEGDITKGLILGMQRVKADSMRNTPVDTGNLKGSHYTVFSNGAVEQAASFDTRDSSGARVAAEHTQHIQDSVSGAKSRGFPFSEVGCTAFYAEKVHEDMEASHVKELYQPKAKKNTPPKFGSVGGPKFLENSIRKNSSLILSLIKRFAKR